MLSVELPIFFCSDARRARASAARAGSVVNPDKREGAAWKTSGFQDAQARSERRLASPLRVFTRHADTWSRALPPQQIAIGLTRLRVFVCE